MKETGINSIKSFNVILYDVNRKIFIKYDVLPYFISCYKEKRKEKPKTFEEFKSFVMAKSQYMYWARCQYEIILSDWPCSNTTYKLDVHEQIMNNIDLVTVLLMNNVIKKEKIDETNKTII